MTDENIKETVKRVFSDYLELKKCRKTPERFAILDMIYSLDGHFNIDMLYEKMIERKKFRVSRATLYNTILLLLDAQLVVRHQFGNSSQYEKLYHCGMHLHLICTQCGSVNEYQEEALQNAIKNTKFKFFTTSHFTLYVYGLCRRCAMSHKRKMKRIINNK